MKAIYINLDPYLAAFAAWLKGGKSGPAPTFKPLPLAVTIPLGETAAYLSPIHNSEPIEVTIDGQTFSFIGPEDSPIATDQQIPGLSAFAPNAYYSVEPIDTPTRRLEFMLTDGGSAEVFVLFTVLVRRETASGPVDLVDFTPPAAAASINAALGGTGAEEDKPLAGVLLNGTKWLIDGETDPSSVYTTAAPDNDNPALAITSPGS